MKLESLQKEKFILEKGFRYICTDCRSFIKNQENIFSQLKNARIILTCLSGRRTGAYSCGRMR